jgi:hypothetical protein
VLFISYRNNRQAERDRGMAGRGRMLPRKTVDKMKEMDGNMARMNRAMKKLENMINDIAENQADIMFHKFHIRRYNVVFKVWERWRETGQQVSARGHNELPDHHIFVTLRP